MKRCMTLLIVGLIATIIANAQTSPQSTINASVQLMSGRPDPGWTINDSSDISKALDLISGLPAAAPATPPRFRSLVLYSNEAVSGFPNSVLVFGGIIRVTKADGTTQFFQDTKGLRTFLVASALAHGIFVEPVSIPSTQVATRASGLAYSRATRLFTGTVTITNISTSTLNGPFQIAFTSLPSGVILENAPAIVNGRPAIPVPSVPNLSPGQSASVTVQFSNPSNAAITVTPIVYTGSTN